MTREPFRTRSQPQDAHLCRDGKGDMCIIMLWDDEDVVLAWPCRLAATAAWIAMPQNVSGAPLNPFSVVKLPGIRTFSAGRAVLRYGLPVACFSG